MGVCMLYGIIARAFLSAPGLVDEELLLVTFEYLVVGLSQLGMGQSVGEEAHKRMLGILTVNPLQSLVVYHTCRVLGALEVVLAKHRILDVLLHHLTHNGCVALRTREAVEEVGIIQMSLELADVAIELVDATLVGC